MENLLTKSCITQFCNGNWILAQLSNVVFIFIFLFFALRLQPHPDPVWPLCVWPLCVWPLRQRPDLPDQTVQVPDPWSIPTNENNVKKVIICRNVIKINKPSYILDSLHINWNISSLVLLKTPKSYPSELEYFTRPLKIFCFFLKVY